jgi:hypothetical protein
MDRGGLVTRRRPTLHELLWPKDSAFDVLKAWPRGFGTRILTRVWAGYDRLVSEELSRIKDFANLEQVERSLTDLHYDKIVALQSGDEPFLPTREVPNFDARHSAKAMPPANDFGFKIRGGDLSLVWPLEAKLVPKPLGIDKYLCDLEDKYLQCRSSPFSPEAGLIAYLVDANVQTTVSAISSRIDQALVKSRTFAQRLHWTTEHVRNVPANKPYPARLRCHHLMMPLKKA